MWISGAPTKTKCSTEARKKMVQFETERLAIRDWSEQFLATFAEMNADPVVMRYFPSMLTPEESRTSMEYAIKATARHGFHFQPIVEKETGNFAGFVGLTRVEFDTHFTPAVEIGWRLPQKYWGKGYAAEAARVFLDYGFRSLELAEIVSFTAKDNHRSRAVMARIGMTQDVNGDFMHPDLNADHPLAHHVLYRIRRDGPCGPESEPG